MGEPLPEIRLVENDKNFDIVNGVDKEGYELPNLNTTLVEVDITKSDIKQISEYMLEIC